MRPHVVVQMTSTIDGRIIPSRWSPDLLPSLTEAYEAAHRAFACDAWMIGRKSMEGFAGRSSPPIHKIDPLPRESWKAQGAAKPYAVVLDGHGKLHWESPLANGDAVVEVLTEAVSDAYLHELRTSGVSYTFAGKNEIATELAPERLSKDFAIERLLLEGGGAINGSFLAAGLVDESSIMVAPIADGLSGTTATFEHQRPEILGIGFSLMSVERPSHDLVHLRYSR